MDHTGTVDGRQTMPVLFDEQIRNENKFEPQNAFPLVSSFLVACEQNSNTKKQMT